MDYFGSLLDAHTAVQPNAGIIASSAQFLKQIQRLRVVWNQDDFVVGCAAYKGQDAIQDTQFARQLRLQTSASIGSKCHPKFVNKLTSLDWRTADRNWRGIQIWRRRNRRCLWRIYRELIPGGCTVSSDWWWRTVPSRPPCRFFHFHFLEAPPNSKWLRIN